MDGYITLYSKGALLFTHALLITPLLMIGFLTRGGFFISPPSQRGSLIWGNASLLVLFTMIFNAFLKSLFLIPLNPVLGLKGFAFPSGHMNVAVVLYGWLLLKYPQRICRLIFLLIILSIGFALIHQGYHNFRDVLGAIGFGIITLCAFLKTIKTRPIQKNPPTLGLYLVLLSGLMIAVIELRIGLTSFMIKTFLGLIGFTLIWFALTRTNVKIESDNAEE